MEVSEDYSHVRIRFEHDRVIIRVIRFPLGGFACRYEINEFFGTRQMPIRSESRTDVCAFCRRIIVVHPAFVFVFPPMFHIAFGPALSILGDIGRVGEPSGRNGAAIVRGRGFVHVSGRTLPSTTCSHHRRQSARIVQHREESVVQRVPGDQGLRRVVELVGQISDDVLDRPVRQVFRLRPQGAYPRGEVPQIGRKPLGRKPGTPAQYGPDQGVEPRRVVSHRCALGIVRARLPQRGGRVRRYARPRELGHESAGSGSYVGDNASQSHECDRCSGK